MNKRVSITQARNALSALISDLEKGHVIEVTRRGKPVAFLLSIKEYNRLRPAPANFLDAHLAFRERLKRANIEIDPNIWQDVRDPSPGREIEF